MKKIIILIFGVTISIIFFNQQKNSYAYAEQNHFAQIMQSETYIYKNTNKEKLFLLPRTYFVTLLDEHEDMYKVEYNGIVGYVDKNNVSCVLNTPKTLYPTRTLRIYSNEGSAIYNSPYKNAKQIGNAPTMVNINFFGTLYGEESIEGRGSDWYYISTTINGEKVYGYVYGGLCDKISKLEINTESVTYIENINFTNSTSVSTATPTQISITTVIVSLSCLMLLIMLFVPAIIRKNTAQHKSKQIISSYYNDNEF